VIESIVINGIRLDADKSKRLFISADERYVIPMDKFGIPTTAELIQINIPKDYAVMS
jgi:hypothetical protein